eukprot:5636539-Prymnesium_polylepis.1
MTRAGPRHLRATSGLPCATAYKAELASCHSGAHHTRTQTEAGTKVALAPAEKAKVPHAFKATGFRSD